MNAIAEDLPDSGNEIRENAEYAAMLGTRQR